jgi:hypothetical protein
VYVCGPARELPAGHRISSLNGEQPTMFVGKNRPDDRVCQAIVPEEFESPRRAVGRSSFANCWPRSHFERNNRYDEDST